MSGVSTVWKARPNETQAPKLVTVPRTIFFALTAATLYAAAQIPTGTELQIRLTSPISSSTGHSGDTFSAVVIAPVIVEGQVAIAQGAAIQGRIPAIAPAASSDEAIVVTPEFTSIGGAPLHAKLTAVDNARESVDEQGRIVGIVPKQTISARLDQGIGKIAQQYPGFADILGAAKGVFVSEADPNIEYPAGVEMTIALTRPLTWTGTATQPSVADVQPADRLYALVNAQPFRTVTDQTAVPSDLTNLMFIGSQQELERAFHDAGWSAASRLNGESKFETFRAIAEMRGYREAPVSVLLLNGRPPDLVFQKQNDTFAARHHLRIWQAAARFNGRQVWLCAATHDTGIDFSPENRTFIHKIDSDIDRERAKVVSDLLFTGKVHALALVERDAVPHEAVNGTGDRVQTDGRMAVLEF